MAYTPISGIVPQLAKNAGGAAAGAYYLKGYVAGDATPTPLSMGTDATPTATLVKCKLNSRGEPISNDADETTVFIPHFNASYKLVLYVNSTDADANTTSNAVWVVDNIVGTFDATNINYRTGQSVGSYLDNQTVTDYTALIAAHAATPYVADDSVTITDVGVASVDGEGCDGTVVTSASHGLSTTTGPVIVLDANTLFKNRNIFSLVPGHFGAIGNKTTDDTVALQAFFDFYKAINAAQPNTTPTCDLSKGAVYYVTSQVVAENFGIRGNGAVLYSDQDISILRTVGQNNIYQDFFVRYDTSTSNSAREAIIFANYPTTNEQNAKNIWQNVVVRNPYRGFVWAGGSGSAGGTAACTLIHCRVDFNWDWGFYADCSTGTTTLTMINCQQFGSLAGGSTLIKGFYINNCADVALLGTTSMDQVYDGLALQITGAKTVVVDSVILESCVLRTDLARMIDINGADVKLGPVHSKVGTYDLPDAADEAYMVQVGSTTQSIKLSTVTKTNTVSTTGTIYDIRSANGVPIRADNIDLDQVQTNGLYSLYYNIGDHAGYSNSFANTGTAGTARRILWNRSPSAGEASYWVDDGTDFQSGPVILGGEVTTATTAQFADITHVVNTEGKYQGKMLPDTTTNLIMVATGATAASTWQPSDGGAVTTPV